MRLPATGLATGLLLVGCAEPVHENARSVRNDTFGGGVALAVVGTPFYATAKAVTCVLATPFPAPSSAVQASALPQGGRREESGRPSGVRPAATPRRSSPAGRR